MITKQRVTREPIFDDIVLRFTRQIYYQTETIFQLEIRKSPGPLAGGAFQADVTASATAFREALDLQLDMEDFFYRYEDPRTGFISNTSAAELGDQLYRLLPEGFRQTFQRLIQKRFERGRGLRLILEARAEDKAGPLLSLPWELLFFEETNLYLAKSPRVLIARRILDAGRRSPAQMKPPYSVAHVIAEHPTDPNGRIDNALQRAEQETIRQAISPGHYRLVERPGAVEQLQVALGEGSYQIVHFLGHGKVETAAELGLPGVNMERGYLQMVSESGETQWVTGEQFQHILHEAPEVRLVVLNACQGAVQAAENVALDLVHSGLPYVVAMQSRISQAAARYFSQAFYEALQSGAGIDQAVAVGRSAIASNMPGSIEWCLPALYTNVGLAELPPLDQTGEVLWHWLSLPAAQRQLGRIGMAIGGVLFLIGLLLLMSSARPALPEPFFLDRSAFILVLMPLLLTLVTSLLKRQPAPNDWPLVTRLTYWLRSFAAAAIGFGMTACYCWNVLYGLASLGFWELLSKPARGVLLILLFSPAVLFGYSQLIGHRRAFVTNAQFEQQLAVDWQELLMGVAGYVIMLTPWIGLRWGAAWFQPPWGALIIGAFWSLLHGLLYHSAREAENGSTET